MALLWTCPQGHHWPPDQQATHCPHCGLPPVEPAVVSDRPTVRLRLRRPLVALPASAITVIGLEETQRSAMTAAWPQVPGCEVLEEIGRGGMAVVYKARQVALGRIVALKMLPGGPCRDPDALTRFRTEAEAIARLQHPGIIQVYEVGVTPAGPYLIMEYARGGSLADRLAGVPQPARTAAALVRKVARAVHTAHQQGILHRDLKPGNILLDEPPDTPLERCSPRISDFGLARRLDDTRGLTLTGQVMGTPGYMPPEQVRGPSSALAPAADVYSLGVLLYEILTGRPPYRGSTALETVHLMLSEDPVAPSRLRPGLPRDLETICLRCLHREPERRYASAADLADDLERFLASRPIAARPTPWWERSCKWARRQPGTATLAGSLVGLAVLALVLVTWQWLRADQAHRRSAREREYALRLARAQAEARREAQRLSARLLLERGVTLCEGGRIGPGLLWLCRSLHVAPVDDAELERSLRGLLGGWGSTLPRLHWYGKLPGEVHAAAVRGDGVIVAGASGRFVHLWEVASGQPAGPCIELPGTVLCLSRVGMGLAAVVRTGDQVRVHRVPERTALGAAVTLPCRPRAAALSRDGRHLLVGGNDHTAFLIHLAEGRIESTWKHTGAVRAVAFSPDGVWAATGGNDRVVRLWHVATGKPVGILEGHTAAVTAVAFSPDGKTVLSGGEDHLAHLWDRDRKTLLHRLLHEQGVCSVVFHPHRPIVATGSYDGTATLWETRTGKPAAAPIRHVGTVSALAFGPAGKSLATAGEDGTVRWWSVRESSLADATLRHPAPVVALAVAPNGRHILTSCAEGGVRLWDQTTGSYRVVSYRQTAAALAFAPDSRSFAAGYHDGNVTRYETTSCRPLGEPLAHGAAVRCAVFSPDGNLLATGCADGDHAVRLWDLRTARVVHRLEGHTRQVSSLAFSPGGGTILSGSWDRTVRLWNVATGQPIGEPMRHHDVVQSVAFSPDGLQALTGGDDYTARLWDVGAREARGLPLEHPDKVQGVAFSPHGWLIATSGKGQLVRLWDAGTGQLLGPPLVHEGLVRSLAFSPDGAHLWTASLDGAVRRWPVPGLCGGNLPEVRTWLEVHTGQRLDDKGALVHLDLTRWQDRVRALGRGDRPWSVRVPGRAR